MLTRTCKLTFSDGQEISAKLTVSTPSEVRPFEWSGRLDRLPPIDPDLRSGSANDIPFLFRQLALDTGAIFTVKDDGQYDRWAE